MQCNSTATVRELNNPCASYGVGIADMQPAAGFFLNQSYSIDTPGILELQARFTVTQRKLSTYRASFVH